MGAVLIIVAGFVARRLKPMLWLAALAIAYVAPFVIGTHGWRVQPEHFAERHGLIVIIAIGESLIAIGAGEKVSGLRAGGDRRRCAGVCGDDLVLAGVLRFLHDPRAPMLSDRSGDERVGAGVAMSIPTCTIRWWRESSSLHSR